MIIGVNGWRLQGIRTGVGRYLYSILRHWDQAMLPAGTRVVLHTAAPVKEPLPANIEVRVHASGSRMLVWENLRLGPWAPDDVMFCPSYSRPILSRARTVVTTHDAVQKVHPEMFPKAVRWFYNPLYGWSARNATTVITDSEAGRQDIARYWGVNPGKIKVIYLAPAEHFQPSNDTAAVAAMRQRMTGGGEPYFVFVGKMTGRRNLPVLIEAYALFKQKSGLPHKLVLIGVNPRNVDIAGLVTKLGIQNEVIHPGYVSDEDLNLVYNGASALVMPSVYETVSLPVMEAQAVGAAVICIDTAGMRELTGDGACRVRVLEPELLAEAMERVAADDAYRQTLSSAGLQSASRFSWRRCAKETLDVLMEAAR